jgi:hypothetical protein
MTDQHVDSEALSEAWDVLYDSLPARWHIGKPSYDPGLAAWTVTAWGRQPDRGKPRQAVTGMGDTEVAALRDLDDRLRRLRKSKGVGMDELRRQLRMAYVDGAEAFSRETLDRGLTGDELGRIIERYEGGGRG